MRWFFLSNLVFYPLFSYLEGTLKAERSMKTSSSLLPIVLTIIVSIHSIPSYAYHDPSSVILLHIRDTPTDERHHHALNNQIHDLVDDMNTWLDVYAQQLSWWERVGIWLGNHTNSAWNDRFCCVRFDYHFGNASICIPSHINQQAAIEQLEALITYKRLPFALEYDGAVHLAYNPETGLEGYALSLDMLERIKHGGSLTSNRLPASENDIKEALFWHHYLPTIGLRNNASTEPSYPFLPHCFSLWELAPSKGNGVKIAIVDTGVAAFASADNHTIKKNYDLEMRADFKRHTYNVVSSDGLDPVEQCIEQMRPLLHQDFNHAQLEKLVPQWINECLAKGRSFNLREFIVQHGNADEKDIQAIEQFINNNFNVLRLDLPYQHNVVEQFVPVVKINKKKITFVAGHGSHSFGTIAGSLSNHSDTTPERDIGICGLAPASDVIMIKAFKDDGVSNKSSLIAALKRAIAYKADIVNLSLKIADAISMKDPSTQLLDRLLGLVPYVIAASGNGRGQESFPAHFESVTFDVGAFRYEKNNNQTRYPVIAFSQYTKDYGPKFVEPGYNILSSGLVPNQKVDSMYTFMSGTSMAAPILSGFVALVLAEFKYDFTADEMNKAIYKSTIHLHDDEDWRVKSLLGTIDMRTCLMTLHIIRALKTKIAHESIMYKVSDHFDNMLEATHHLLFSMPTEYSNRYLEGCSFKNNFTEYKRRADEMRQHNPEEYKHEMAQFNRASLRLKPTISHTADCLLYCIKGKSAQQKSPFMTQKLFNELSAILQEPKVELFGHLSSVRQRRLEKKVIIDNYWKEQARKLQEGI
jgi:subtilisin family serine protease